MAKLCRFVKLWDRHDAQVFTFVVPGRLTREFTPDSYSQDFVYGNQRWQVSFLRSDRHIGVFLRLQTTSAHMTVGADFTVTVLNREHFTRNETFMEKGCDFSTDNNVFGRKNFIEIDDLLKRQFMQDNGDMLVELEIRNCNCIYESYLRLPKESHHSRNQGYNNGVGERLETSYFSFGLFDWNLSLCDDASRAESDGGGVAVQLVRHTSFDHLCRVRFRVALGEGEAFHSGELTQLLDAAGWGEPFSVGANLYRLSRGRSAVRVKVEMLSVVSVSEVSIPVLNKALRRAHCYDRDKQAWTLEADTSGKFLLFKLYYTDISHVPRKFLRYVCWNLRVLSRRGGAVKAADGPFSRYYVQQDLDDGLVMKTEIQVDEQHPDCGFTMRTNIPVSKLSDPHCPYLEPEERRMTVHLEWIDSHLLISPHHNTLDDVPRLHKHQMWREILALQAENYALERQLYSYQQSIAQKDARGRSRMEPLSNQSSFNS